MIRTLSLTLLLFLGLSSLLQASAGKEDPAYPAEGDRGAQYSHFPIPTHELPTERAEDGKIDFFTTIKARIKADPFNLVATIIFLLAICHTFAAGAINKAAHKAEVEHRERIRKEGRTACAKPHEDAEDDASFKATALHFLGEIEAIFGIWIIALAAAAIGFYSWEDFEIYVSYDREFKEPIFVVVIMAIAASRPVLRFSELVMARAAALGSGSPAAWWLSVMTIAPILGSFITEPAAMTIGALLLAKKFYPLQPKPGFAYATLGLLFVNVSVGGTLTHFAAPPVLMVASEWGWNMQFMFLHFGWKAVLAILASNAIYFALFRKELLRIADTADGVEDGVSHPIAWHDRDDPVPAWVIFIHVLFLGWTVYTAHFPVLFIGGFLFFMAFVVATRHHQNAISMRGPMLVGFFLAALIIHGGCQAWWIEPVILTLPDNALMLGSTILTAFNDNAAITYLASQVDGISTTAKYAVVAGAVTGGGLTVIANAPNPAGQSILTRHFEGGISPLKLLLGALIPTIICYAAFSLLPNLGGSPSILPAEETEAHGDAVPGTAH